MYIVNTIFEYILKELGSIAFYIFFYFLLSFLNFFI